MKKQLQFAAFLVVTGVLAACGSLEPLKPLVGQKFVGQSPVTNESCGVELDQNKAYGGLALINLREVKGNLVVAGSMVERYVDWGASKIEKDSSGQITKVDIYHKINDDEYQLLEGPVFRDPTLTTGNQLMDALLRLRGGSYYDEAHVTFKDGQPTSAQFDITWAKDHSWHPPHVQCVDMKKVDSI